MTKKKKKQVQKNIFLACIGTFIAFMIIFLSYLIFGNRTLYHVVVYNEQAQAEEIAVYQDYKQATIDYQRLLSQGAFNPAIVDDKNKIVAIKYGIVNFHTKEANENTSFTYENSEKKGYLNGSYGGDGAYLSTSEDGTQVEFMMSGARGYVDLKDVEILNYYSQDYSLSHYQVKDGMLFHNICVDPVSDEVYPIELDETQSYFTDSLYYSYDGMYFYSSYIDMIEDYRSRSHSHSINENSPYVNYYQYVSHRTQTNYTKDEINQYITQLGYSKLPSVYPMEEGASQLVDRGNYFIDYQNTYGANALMMLALSINESDYGTSELAFTKNNVFGHQAYDEDPTKNAQGYASVPESIKTHASKYLNQGYLNVKDSRYYGSFFGNKGSGMNVMYASDPYWGEKAASFYRKIDSSMGGKDAYAYDIIVMKEKAISFYSEPSVSNEPVYTSDANFLQAITVLEKVEGDAVSGNTLWYKVHSDGCFNDDRTQLIAQPETYRYETDVWYVPAAYFTS